MRIEVLVDVKTTLGEGPLWDVGQQRLYWIDSFDGRVFRCTHDGREVRAWDVPEKIGSIAIRKDGNGAICSLANGFHTLDFKTGDVELIHDPEPGRPANRLNDGKVDKRGRFVAGSMDTMEEGPNGALYRLDPDMSVHKIDDGIIVSNGPCWSPDGKILYFAEFVVRGDLGLRLRPRHRQRRQPADLHQGRYVTRRCGRRRHGGQRGLRVERRRLCQQAHPLRAGRHRRPGHRHAGQEGDQRHVRRAGPRCPVRHLDGQAAAAALPRRRGARGSLFAIYDLGITGLPEPRFGG